MKSVKNITLFVKNKQGVVTRHLTHSYRRFYSKSQGYRNHQYRVLVRYHNFKNEYGTPPTNDSGWYANKEELKKTASIFLEK